MAQVDAVAVLQHPMVMVRQGRFKHCTDAQRAAGCGPHPHYVVVAPLDVHTVVTHQQIQDDLRMRSPVEQVAPILIEDSSLIVLPETNKITLSLEKVFIGSDRNFSTDIITVSYTHLSPKTALQQ